MKTNLRSRLNRLKRKLARAKTSRMVFVLVKDLPDGYVGERHIARVKGKPLKSPNGMTFDYEERPGPGPRPPDMHDGVLTIYMTERDIRTL